MNPRLPGYFAPEQQEAPAQSTRGKLTARQVQSLATPKRDTTVTVTAANTPIPIPYGKAPRAGEIFAIGKLSGDLVVGVGWGYGECRAIEKVFINDAALPISGVTVTHYLGTTTQTADATLSSAIAAYSDDLILRTPQGDIGICYSVFRIETGAISGAPRFSAIIRGRKVLDPRIVSPDPYTSARYWRILINETATTDSFFTQIAEIEMRATVGGADQCSGGTASASSADGSNSAANAFDNSNTSFWVSQNGEVAPQWIQYDFGTAKAVAEITIRSGSLSSGAARAPTAFEIQASNNGSTWTTVYDFTSTGWTATTTRNFEIPEASDVVYSDNSALCTADLATNAVFGMGATVNGVSDCADWCDSLLGGAVPRSRLALTFTQPQRTEALIDLGATYGEMIWYWEGPEITFVPDQAVDTGTVPVESNCVRDTLAVEGIDDGDTPSRVYVRYTEPSTTSGYWQDALTPQSLPGVSEGEAALVESTLSLPGVTRSEEANNKALARLEQMKNRVRVSWVTTDKGIVHRKGDVVRHQMTTRGTDIYVRIQSVQMISYGRYRVTGMRYDPAHYPSELVLPEGTGTIPVGAILPLSGSAVPDGWAAFTAANGKYIVGAGSTYSGGDTGGDSTSIAANSTVTTTDSMHNVSSGTAQRIHGTPGEGTFGNGSITEPGTDHNHTVSTPGFTIDPIRRENRLIKKTGAAGTTVPSQVQIFGLPNISVSGLSRVVASANRVLVAAAANADQGSSLQSLGSVTSGAGGVSHDHSENTGIEEDIDFGPNPDRHLYGNSGSHTHPVNLYAVARIKSKTIALWGSGDEYPIVPGMIVLWENLASLPTDWVICDGTGATPDLRDYFIKIASIGGENVASGDNTLRIYGSANAVYHGHMFNPSEATRTTRYMQHGSNGGHNHNLVALTPSWTPPYYALGAIMYSPS